MATFEHDEFEAKPLTANEMVYRSFWLGFIFHMLTNLFIQDWYGLEKYKNVLDNGWVDIHWGVWIAPMFIILVIYNWIAKLSRAL
jgi:hypothetical protein